MDISDLDRLIQALSRSPDDDWSTAEVLPIAKLARAQRELLLAQHHEILRLRAQVEAQKAWAAETN